MLILRYLLKFAARFVGPFNRPFPPGNIGADSDFVPPEDPCMPADPDEFVRICVPPGEPGGWNDEDWRAVLTVDLSGLDFSACGNEADCLAALAAYPWEDLLFTERSSESTNACAMTGGAEWADQHSPPWSAAIDFTRFNGPPVDNIRVSFASGTSETPIPGLPAIWFLADSPDRFSSSDYPDWVLSTASPPFSFFPVSWTQTPRCGANSCPTGVAVFTLGFEPAGEICDDPPDLPRNPCDSYDALCEEPDPCETGAALCDDDFDWCWTIRRPDGTCPKIPGPADQLQFEPYIATESLPEHDVVAGRRYWLSTVLPGGGALRAVARPFIASAAAAEPVSMREGHRYYRYPSSCAECDCVEDCGPIQPEPWSTAVCSGNVCCDVAGVIIIAPLADCQDLGGSVVTGGCSGLTDPPPAVGACCLGGQCTETLESICLDAGGTYLGDFVGCLGASCS